MPLTGTAGPGGGVACVTIVMALLWGAAVDGRPSVLVVDSDASPLCWTEYTKEIVTINF